MKKKTSISLSDKLLKLIDTLPEKPARSAVIEEALILYFRDRKKMKREKADLEILNSINASLAEEALDSLKYQSD